MQSTIHLNNDILLLVFKIIATERNVDIGRRQAAIRYASQVCQRWRDLILPASYIWGRLVWVNRTQQLPWMQEVFERAKTASLFSVTLDGQREPVDEEEEVDRIFNSLAIAVLKTVWDRLEEAYISYRSQIYESEIGPEFHNNLWEQIRNPAPSLRSIIIFDSDVCMVDPFPEDAFKDDAPLLQEISYIPASISGPNTWLSRITSLGFTPLTLEDIMNAVSWAPNLKVLRLGEDAGVREFLHPEDSERLKSMSPIILSRLARIGGIEGLGLSFEAFTTLWSSRFMSPAEAYSNISISIHETNIIEGQGPGPSQFLDALSNFFYHHWGITPSTIHHHDLKWSVRANCTEIVIEAQPRGSSSNPELYIKLTFDWDEHRGNFELIAPFVVRAITEYARRIKHLHFQFLEYYVGTVEDYINNRIFDSFLLSMEDVKSIIVGYTTPKYYNKLDEEYKGRELFPKLEIVYLICGGSTGAWTR
ncbi:hypothetical protein D9613_008255 [Agrocybe pediades]|uniref:F-box domain-containing protein n=1 Tax=Agrocybe pediades TaxID=84607 RepID=A0A8H4QSU7_9AGAR|nr:hypothetical protein D9613_008255 [Agrocybe pediades]